MTSSVIRKAVAKGVQDGHFGYVSGPKPPLSADGKFQVAPSKVRFKTAVADDEIDLESGFLMLPQAIPQEAAPIAPDQPIVRRAEVERPIRRRRAPEGGSAGSGGQPQAGRPKSLKNTLTETSVQLNFSTDRNGLFTAWNAIANLADMAEKVESDDPS